MNIIRRLGVEIVTLDEAKANSRVTATSEDGLFQSWISLAHSYCETYTHQVLQLSEVISQSQRQKIQLNTPVREIISVVEVDENGERSAVTDYKTTATPAYGVQISIAKKCRNYFEVKYIAGFGEHLSANAINPEDIAVYPQFKSAILLLVNHFYENRGVVSDFSKYEIPIGVKSLLNQVKKYK